MAFLRKYWFRTTIAILVVLFVGASYVRFMVKHDYMVAYEGDCDPYTQSCFIGCEDDECTTEYYYSQIQKYAPNVYGQCGADITDCENAYVCLSEDGEQCSITFCDPKVDGESCETLTEDDIIDEEIDSSEIETVMQESSTELIEEVKLDEATQAEEISSEVIENI